MSIYCAIYTYPVFQNCNGLSPSFFPTVYTSMYYDFTTTSTKCIKSQVILILREKKEKSRYIVKIYNSIIIFIF